MIHDYTLDSDFIAEIDRQRCEIDNLRGQRIALTPQITIAIKVLRDTADALDRALRPTVRL